MNIIGQYLEKTGKTQKEFAAEVGTSAQHMNKLVNGKRTPEIPTVAKLRKASGGFIDYHHFAGGE
jgi:transcriptional regulator with XRE-family HTH domain